jgi:hypothetical protein
MFVLSGTLGNAIVHLISRYRVISQFTVKF